MPEERSTENEISQSSLDIQVAGDEPPSPPSAEEAQRKTWELHSATDNIESAYLLQISLDSGAGRSVAKRVLNALKDRVTVFGTTIHDRLDRSDPNFDVLIEGDYEQKAIASSLARVGPVLGVVVVDVTPHINTDSTNEDRGEFTASDVFQELKKEVGKEGYGDVVEELEGISFPGGPDPNEEVDLRDELDSSEEITAPDKKAIENALLKMEDSSRITP